MATKVSRMIKQLATWFKQRVEAADPSTFVLVLLNALHTFDYEDTWADVSSLECSFKGYSRINLTGPGYNNPTEPTTGKWQVRTPPATFAYDSGAGGLASEMAYMWALIEMSGSVENLMELKDLTSPKLFAADGDELPLEHFYNSLNCDE